MKKFIWLFILILTSIGTAVHAQGTGADIEQWKEQFEEANFQKLLKEVEKNLASGSPHPYAINAWVTSHEAMGDLGEALEQGSEDWQNRVRDYVKVRELMEKGHEWQLFDRYASKKLNELDEQSWANVIINTSENASGQTRNSLLEYLKKPGLTFRAVWAISNIMENNEQVRRWLAEQYQKGAVDKESLAGRFIYRQAVLHQQSAIDKAALVKAEQALLETDALANRFLAHQLKAMEHFEEAEAHFRRSYELNPFYPLNMESIARTQASLSNFEAASRTLRRAARQYAPADTARYYYRKMALVLLDSDVNHLGMARTNVEAGLAAFPDDPELNYQMGRVESESGRNEFAVTYYKKAVDADPQNLNYWQDYLEALNSTNMIDDFMMSVETLRGEFEVFNPEIHDEIAEMFMKYEEYDIALDEVMTGLEYFPEASLLYIQKGQVHEKLEEYDEAIAAFEQVIKVDEVYAWPVQQIVRLMKQKGDTGDRLLQKLNELAFTYYWDVSPWQEWADEVKDTDEKMEIWNTAMEKNPFALFPYERVLRDIQWPARQWDLALANLDKMEGKLKDPKASASDRALLYFEKGIVYIGKLRSQGISTEEYERALPHFREYLERGGYSGAYYQFTYELHYAQKELDKAEEALRNWIRYRPNSHTNRSKAVTQMAGKFPDRFRIYHELVERQPHDWQNWDTIIRYNALWSGSAINAIRYGKEFSERFPERKDQIRSLIGSAYGKLGSSIKDFEDSYSSANSVGASERYVNWFLSSKKQAWQGSTQLTFDWDTNSATLLFEDGTLATLTDDPATGVTKKIQIGDAFIEARYNEEVQLTHILRSDGAGVELIYNEGGEITEMKSPEQEDISFAYDSLTGKPNLIIIESDIPDSLTVVYSPAGDIEKVESSSGQQAALKITQAFQRLLKYTRAFSDASRAIASGSLPDLGITDETYQELRERGTGYDADIGDTHEFIKYLVSNTHVDPDYGKEALNLIEQVFNANRDSDDGRTQSILVDIIELNYRLMMKIRTSGLPRDAWTVWADMTDWLIIREANGVETERISALRKEIDEHPLELLPSSQWLPKSDLYNTSYWKNFDIASLVKDTFRNDITVNTAFIRDNGDVLLGTNKGLLVYNKGYWQHLAYNFIRRSFQNNVEAGRINATSDILSIAEDSTGTMLYLGTSDGLFVLDSYKGRIRDRVTVTNGLPSKTISHLRSNGDKLVVGTPAGAAILPGALTDPILLFEGEETAFIEVHEDERAMIVGTNKAVYAVKNDGTTGVIHNEFRKDGVMSFDAQKLFTLKGKQVWVSEFDQEGNLREHVLNGQLITTDAGQVYGLSYIPVSPNEYALAVQTDLGLSIYHDRHFEHYYLDRERKSRPRITAQKQGRFVAVTDEDIRIFQRSPRDVSGIAVKDMISFEKLGFTVAADGRNPKVIAHDDPANTIRELAQDSYMSTSVLAKEDEYNLLLNDGQQIIRYSFHPDSAGYTYEELFYAAAEIPNDDNLVNDQSIKNIIPGGDGSVWVANGNAIFHYRGGPGGLRDVTEYNYFNDPETFPCYSDMVYRVFKTVSDDIYAVCSNEGHRYYQGISLKGGLLKYVPEEKRFIRVDTSNPTYNWFVHSYTPLGDNEAILGTASGFAVEKAGEWTGLRYWKSNESYDEVYENHPSLYLGTRGASLGDLWLFGSASGLVAYYNDNWFYPTRINAQLPKDSEYGRYGGRHVNAVAASPQGKIYVGTDLGLLVYDSESDDPTKFIMDNYSVEKSLEFFNTKILQDEQDRIFSLKDIPDNSNAAELIRSLKETNEQIALLETAKGGTSNPLELLPGQRQNRRASSAVRDSLEAELKILNQKQSELLLTLQQREPSLFQAIQIDPLDLRSSRTNMREGDVVVQYIPMSRKLFIQVLSKEKFQLREVEITGPALMDSVRLVRADLAQKAGGLRVGTLGGNEKPVVKLSEERLTNLLSYLYEQLIRPIENDLVGYENVYIAPVSVLNYLPFSALIDRQSERDMTYAVERYNIGYVSSMYLFNLIYQDESPVPTTALLIGDPDGSLAGARDEVKEIQELLSGSQTLIGKEASTSAFHKLAESNHIIHLATHGFLNEESLKESWLLFSDKNFTLSEVYNLDLGNSSLVVLSACQTSLGGAGLEYATLSRAFLNAGTPSIVGTLWKVDDMPSKELMVAFYRKLAEGHNKFKALALAKRELIGSGDQRFNHPSKWASYIMIGKP